MDISQQWGLPEGFQPVRHPIPDEAKNALRGRLEAGEPVIITIANDEDTVSIVATPQRMFTIKTGVGAGAAGLNVREYPWEAVFDLILTSMTYNVKIAVQYRSNDGRRIEVGRRAMMGKPVLENLAPFEMEAGKEVFRALLQVWNTNKMRTAEGGETDS